MGEGRFSGTLEVTVTARTPLLIGGFPAEGGDVTGLQKRQDGTAMIPGSGLMGAVRSLHEALTGSCLRIVDTGRVPVHRHPVNNEETRDLILAVVDAVDGDGRARSVLLCNDWVKIPKALLLGAGSRGGSGDELWQTGDQFQFEPGRHDQGDALRVRQAEHGEGFEPGGLSGSRSGRMGPVTGDRWVLLVTDTGARNPQGRNGKPAPVQFAAGRTGPDARRCGVSDLAWEQYGKVVEGANDLRTAELKKAGFESGEEPRWGTCPPEYADVWWPPRSDSGDAPVPRGGSGQGQMIGRRLHARSYLHVGQPIWVRVDGGAVTEIRLSLYWRYRGTKTVGERLGEAQPCTDPENLCWSCRMFGSADTAGRTETDLAEQHSYRGHVRIDDLLATGPVDPISWDLAPLASPKPGAGQFYLDNSAVPGSARIAKQYTKPAATWGSIADAQHAEQRRPVRGRKFYWRTETAADPAATEPHRGRRRPHQSEAMSGKVSLIPAETTFKGRVAFDNLDAAEYGSLLAALDPRLLGSTGDRSWARSVNGIGGGKPFGFGSVAIDIGQVSLNTAAQRYLGEPGPPPPGEEEAVEAFQTEVTEAVRVTWPALRHALEFGFIEDAKVWYPPGGGNRGEADYDKSFEFFARTTGLRMQGDRYRDLVVLPDAAAPAARQELDSTAGEHGGAPQQQGQGDQARQRPGQRNAQPGPRPRPGDGRRGEGRDVR